MCSIRISSLEPDADNRPFPKHALFVSRSGTSPDGLHGFGLVPGPDRRPRLHAGDDVNERPVNDNNGGATRYDSHNHNVDYVAITSAPRSSRNHDRTPDAQR